MSKQSIDPKLKAYLAEIKEQFKPDSDELHRRIQDATLRHLPYLELRGDGHLILVELQDRILEGYRYNVESSGFRSGYHGYLTVNLQKPQTVIDKELQELAEAVTAKYHKELETAMDRKVEQLMQEAAEAARKAAEEQARLEAAEIKQKLKEYLLS